MRHASISVLILCALAAQAIPKKSAAPATPQKATARKIPCKTSDNASLCYWTRGRLNFANGDPSYRIWKVGTKPILAVYSGPSHFPPRTEADSELPEFPPNVDQVFRPPNNWIFADFEVCPLEPERKGEIQAVCIESAKNIVVGK
jgi:hypothetical protein